MLLQERKEPVGPGASMRPFGLREVERQVVRQDAVPELGLGPRDDLVCLRQLLDVSNASHKRIVEKLRRSDLQYVQDDLGILRVVLVKTVVQGLLRPGQADRGNQLQLEPRLPEMMRQGPVIVAGRLEPNPRGQTVDHKNGGQAPEFVERVCDGQPTAALLARNADQDLWRCLEMSMATNKVEAVVSVAVAASLLSGVVCAKPLLRPENRLWPPAALLGGCARL